MVDTYRARRRLQMAPDVWREPDELVPEARAWVRVDAYEHTGYIVKAEVSEKEFYAAVKQFCPELKQRLTELAGLDPDVRLEGPHGTPRRNAPVLIPLKDTAKKAAPTKATAKGTTTGS